MNRQEIIQGLSKVLKILESIDFMSYQKSIQNANQLKTHNAYNMIDNLIKSLKEEENNG